MAEEKMTARATVSMRPSRLKRFDRIAHLHTRGKRSQAVEILIDEFWDRHIIPEGLANNGRMD